MSPVVEVSEVYILIELVILSAEILLLLESHGHNVT